MQIVGCERSGMQRFLSYLIQRESDRRWSRIEGHTVEGKKRKYKFKKRRQDYTKEQMKKDSARKQTSKFWEKPFCKRYLISAKFWTPEEKYE